MIVMKFGGTSISNSKRIRNVAEIVKSRLAREPVVVVSAMGGVTNSLVEIANAHSSGRDASLSLRELMDRHYRAIEDLGLGKSVISKEADELERVVDALQSKGRATLQDIDQVMSFGERMAARIVSACLASLGVISEACDAYDIGMLTDSNPGYADILPEAYQSIRAKLAAKHGVPVITGFIGKDADGHITTLGRGGSDYTASIIGAAMDAEEIEIWTDVDGIMTADPKVVDTARNIESLSYEEEAELEALGATNLNPKGIHPAMEKNIPVRILNALNPAHRGTLVHRDARASNGVASITYRKGMKVIAIEADGAIPNAFINAVRETFSRNSIPIRAFSTTGERILVAIDERHDQHTVTEELGKIAKLTVMEDMSQVSLIGSGLSNMPDVSETLSSTLSSMGAEPVVSGNPKINQSVVVMGKHTDRAVRQLHGVFFGR
jgi:aspartate kinase